MTGAPGSPMQGGMGPIAGSVRGEIVGVAPASIHGDIYYDLTLRTDPARNLGVKVRAPSHACRVEPRTGQFVRVSMLMGQVTAVEIEAGDPPRC